MERILHGDGGATESYVPTTYPPVIDGLMRTVRTVVGRRAGRLVGLTIAVPPASADVAAQLRRCLEAEGFVDLDIRVVAGAGPHRVLAVEFEE